VGGVSRTNEESYMQHYYQIKGQNSSKRAQKREVIKGIYADIKLFLHADFKSA
jgi:hypothetical protein